MGTTTLIGFGARLKAAREEAGLSGAELGVGLQNDGNASRQTVSDWEHERHYPNVWQLREICLKVGKSADFFLFGDIEGSERLREALQLAGRLSERERLALFAALRSPADEPSRIDPSQTLSPEKAKETYEKMLKLSTPKSRKKVKKQNHGSA